ncbi:MAG: hypothetical protein V7K97_22525 [Nostoc sp.]|uniref:hypothetical protein n=1 Tax=Nostoc sp. TaxID=1180 RepID=UPI002FF70A7E
MSRSQFICPDITLYSDFAGRRLVDGASFDGKSVGDTADVLGLLNSSDRSWQTSFIIGNSEYCQIFNPV